MPEHESAPAAPVGGVAGGYPPMTPLRGAVPGWPEGRALTWASTPEVARAVLRAEAGTSVLDPRGLRRLWWLDVRDALVMVLLGLMVLASVQGLRSGELPGWWLILTPVVVLINAGDTYLTVAVTRALPAAGVRPRAGSARWRWHRHVRHEPVAVPPPAAWPPGAEAYAVLSAAASGQSVAPTWLGQRIGLAPEVGPQWVAALRRQGWLAGGGRVLGVPRLPELHVELTDAGRDVVATERARLQALADG